MSLPTDSDGPPYSVTVLRRFADFVALEAEWRELFAAAERPLTTLRHRWLRLSWQLVWRRPFNGLRVILIRDRAGRLVMAGAFVTHFYRMVPTVSFLNSGTPQIDELLWRPSPDTTAQATLLLETLARVTRPAFLLRSKMVSENSPLHAARAALGFPNRVRKTMASPFLRLTDYPDYASYFASLSTNIKVDHRRRLRRLGELPGFVYTHDTGEAAREAIAWSMQTKREWLVERGYRADWLVSGHVDRFLLAYLDGEDDIPELWVASFRVGSQIIANTISFIEGRVVTFSKIAHDPDYGKHSPGRTLALREIEHAFGRGLGEFDFGAGTVAWKRRLTSTETTTTSERIRLR